MIKQSKHKEDQQEDDNGAFLGYHLETQVHEQKHITVTLDEDIKNSKYYRMVVEALYSANEGDTATFRIDSIGGDLAGALALITAIENTNADVHCFVSGECASAATIIALACPSISVSERSNWMFHSASTVSGGKLGNLIDNVSFTKQQVEKLMREMYAGFLSDKEIEELIIGRDIYMTAEEAGSRLEKRFKYLENKSKRASKQSKSEINTKVAKKRSKGSEEDMAGIKQAIEKYNEVVE